MAKGGVVNRFCDSTKEHKSNCQYAKGGFVLQNEDNSHYTLKHPKGDLLKIAKKGLSPQLHSQIKKFAKGGEVKPEPLEPKNPISESFNNATGSQGIKQSLENIKHYDDGGSVSTDTQKPVTININTDQNRQVASNDAVQTPGGYSVPTQDKTGELFNKIGEGAKSAWNFLNTPITPEAEAAAAPQSNVQTSPANYQQVGSAPNAYQNVNFTQTVPGQEQMPQAPKPTAPNSQNDYPSQLKNDIGMFQQGVQQKAQAEEAVASQMKPQYEQQANTMAEWQRNFEQNKDYLHRQMTETADELNSGKIDFNRVWHDKGTGKKIMAGIGMLLSGLGSGLTGQPNLALKVINDEIDRDIESQKANRENKRTALQAYSQITGDMDRGAQQLRLGADALVAAQLNKVMTSQAGPLAQSRAKLAMAEFLPQMQERLHSAAMQQTMFDQMNKAGSGPDQMNAYFNMLDMLNPQMAKEKRAQYIPEVGAMASRPVEAKDQAEISKRIKIDRDWNDLINQVESLSPADKLNPSAIATVRAKAGLLLNSFRQGEGLGVPREASQEFEKTIIDPHPDSFLAGVRGTLSKYRVTREDNLNSLQSKLNEYGVKKVPTSVAGSRLRPHNEVMNVANRPR